MSVNNELPLNLFVHVPKTGGTSLRKLVMDHYGPSNVWMYRCVPDRFYLSSVQYLGKDDEFVRPVAKRFASKLPDRLLDLLIDSEHARGPSTSKVFNEAQAVIGHFAIEAFDNQFDGRITNKYTVVREPLARMVSHYKYAQSKATIHPKLKGWMKHDDPGVSFEEFAFSDHLQNFQTKYTGCDANVFTQVGTLEKLNQFAQSVGLINETVTTPHLRKTSQVCKEPLTKINDKGFIRDFIAFHDQDYAFYQQVTDVEPLSTVSLFDN